MTSNNTVTKQLTGCSYALINVNPSASTLGNGWRSATYLLVPYKNDEYYWLSVHTH